MELKIINKRRMCGATISEYLPILGLIATILVGGVAQYGNEARKQSSRMSIELAGVDAPFVASNSASTPGYTGGSNNSGSGQTDNTSPNHQNGTGSGSTGGSQVVAPADGTGQQINPVTGQPIDGSVVSGGSGGGAGTANTGANQNDAGVLEQVVRFIEGAANGMKTQITGIIQMVLNPIETANALKELAVALVTEPEETLKVLAEVFKEDLEKLTSGDPYLIGEVIGENVSPATLVAIVSKLRKIDKIANSTRRQDTAKDVDTACSSFLAGTAVWTENGMVPIETLAVGDRVHSRHGETFADKPQRITHLFHRDVTHYYEVDTGYEVIRTTEEHPFWLQGKGWTPASQLKVGDVLARAEGDIQIHKVRRIQGPASVYNFTVEKTHNYFVGPNKLWVHNANVVCDLAHTRYLEIRARIPAHLRKQFDDDFSNPGLKEALLKNPNLADAWELVASHEKIRVDLPTLNKLDNLLKDREVMDVLGKDGLQDIIKNAKNPLGESSSSLVSLTRHLDNIQLFVKNHKNVPGFNKTIQDLKSTPLNMQKGVTHALEVMRVYPEGSIKKMDMTFEVDGGPCPNCRFDLELHTSGKAGELRYVEFKSYKLESIAHLPVNQLKSYFHAAQSISEMKYVFNKLDTPNLNDVKRQMQKVFEQNADEIFTSMSPELLKSLKIETPTDFKNLIEKIDSELYQFIEIN